MQTLMLDFNNLFLQNHMQDLLSTSVADVSSMCKDCLFSDYLSAVMQELCQRSLVQLDKNLGNMFYR